MPIIKKHSAAVVLLSLLLLYHSGGRNIASISVMSGLRAALAGTHEYRNWIFTPAEQLSLDSRHLAPLLSTSLSVLFAVWVPFRIWHLRGATLKVLPSLRGLVKAVCAGKSGSNVIVVTDRDGRSLRFWCWRCSW